MRTGRPDRLGAAYPRAPVARLAIAAAGALLLFAAAPSNAAGTPAGTVIENAARVDFDVNGTPASQNSNTVSITVDERIDVTLTVPSPQRTAAAGETSAETSFVLTNTGNGSEAFSLIVDSQLGGDDFDPLPASPDVYFDSDGSGDLTPGDTPYTPGTNEPVLSADESVTLLVVHDIPVAAPDGGIGRVELRATSVTLSGAAGSSAAGAGDGGVDAVVGASGAEASEFAEYLVEGTVLAVVKSVQVSDPFGGASPVPGAVLEYRIDVTVNGSLIAAGSVLNDPLPDNTTYLPDSLTLNGAPLSDVADADAGELVAAPVPAVVVRLGDLTEADGTQTITFQVAID